MTVIGEASLRITPDAQQFGPQVKREATQGLTGIGSSLGSVFKSELGQAALAGGLAGAITAGLPQALGRIKDFVGSAVDSFEEAEKAQIALQTALLNNPRAASVSVDAYNEQAAALQDLTGFQDEAVLGVDALLARFQLTGDQIRDVTPLVLDFARMTGGEATSAALNLGRAYLGNTRALKTLGINYKTTGDAAEDFDNITKLVQSRVGGFAERQAQTLSGQLEILRANFDDIKESIGGVVVPYLTLGAKAANFLTNELTSTSSAGGILGTAAKNAAAQVVPLGRALQGLSWGAKLLTGDQTDANEALNAAIGTVGSLNQQLSTGAITTEQYRRARSELVAGLREEGVAEDKVAQVQQSSRNVLAQYRTQVLGVADAHREAAATALAERVQELALAGGFLGLRGALLSTKSASDALETAQAALDKLQRHGKQGTEEWRDAHLSYEQAVLGAATSQQALAAAVAKYIQDQQKDGAPTQREVNREVAEFGRQAGLSRTDVANLGTSVLELIDAQRRVPATTRLQFESNLDQVIAQLNDAIRKANRLGVSPALLGDLDVTGSGPPAPRGGRSRRGGGTSTGAPAAAPSPVPSPSPGPVTSVVLNVSNRRVAAADLAGDVLIGAV